MEVAVFVQGGTAILVPACFLPCDALRREYPQAQLLCTARLKGDPQAGWAASRMRSGEFVPVPLASAILLLHELVSLPG